MESGSAQQFIFKEQGNIVTLVLNGRIGSGSVAGLYRKITRNMGKAGFQNLIIDLGAVSYLDAAGAVFITHLKKYARSAGFENISTVNLKGEFSNLIRFSDQIKPGEIESFKPEKLSFVEKQGSSFYSFFSDAKEFITLAGQIKWTAAASLKSLKTIQWSQVLLTAEQSGVDALPIVALISFIVGLVMAFQAAIPLKMFGTEIYVANLIGIAMVRELGPLMTAIVLAGRSASAFAAEIGTMRINEEIDALTVMGIDPVKFLVLPRIIASTFMTPLLTIFSNFVGMVGGAFVVVSLGYPVAAYLNQVTGFVQWEDFAGGIAKSFVFGVIIAAAGCIRGFQTGSGPSAVGISTTRAVVTGIILITVFDAAFSIVYFYLGI